MIVCSCNALNCRKVKDAVEAGARKWTEVHAHHGVAPNCCSCAQDIAALIRRQREAALDTSQPLALAAAAD